MNLLKLTGLAALKGQLRAIEKEAAKQSVAAVREAFRPVLAAARATAPEDTGLLKKSTKMAVVKNQGKTVAAAGIVVKVTDKAAAKADADGSGVRNWAWYERGVPAHGIAARPYIRPAFDSHVDDMVSTLRTAYDRIIKEAVQKGGG